MNNELNAILTADSFILDVHGEKCLKDNKSLIKQFERDKYKALYELGFGAKKSEFAPALTFLQYIAKAFVKALSRDNDIEITRKAKPVEKSRTALEILHIIPYTIGIEHVSIEWIEMQWTKLAGVFDREISVFQGTVADYLKGKSEAINVVGRVFFHLVESGDESYPFAFLATYSTGTREKLSHLPLKNALLEYKDEQEALLALLSTVSRAADKSEFISELAESGELFSPLKFNPFEAYTVLKEIPLYEECGIVCRIPDWWKRNGNVKISVSVGDDKPSIVGIEAILSFNPSIFLGDVEMTREEIEMLLSQTSGLSFIKGKWVEVDNEKLQVALAAFDKAGKMTDMTFAEAMRMQLSTMDKLSAGGLDIEVTNGQWLREIKEKLLNPEMIKDTDAGGGFKADLRHYQQKGLNWLAAMKTLGFGALLADDMGLGKTVQILALLEHMREKGGKTLLVIPASLIFNWKNEAERFAPDLRYSIIHASHREIDLEAADLFITTYGMVQRLEKLKDVAWDLIVLDEAQAIKNSGTKQTKAVKALKSSSRIAMTGTPIENKLSDLWSIFDFLNKGMLGTAKEFRNFSKGLHENMAGYSRLRGIVNPFILRRLKTDKAVIADLPDKIEMKEYTSLTKKQVVLYKSLVTELEAALENTDEGISRKGLVLASIMKFKQICNHPDQYLGQNSFNAAYSGKFERLAEICETIFEKRERVLIFTQFKEMTKPICDYLEEAFGRKGLLLHGGTMIKNRGELVKSFNGEEYVPFMVLSVKAGGVGLNLTAANHVIHFDRWWNPAVENQATDRAFRIGQQKNVTVHKFITAGTIEEKIDKMLEEKQKLADDIIADSGEKWVTELNNEELMKLFKLEV
ncbi:MAG: DEAD/DEAH box helicase [Oscillospiraceae bacterium]|nr:DEAD/DEAH box helicase [Oscillospiraceae bacterium]